MGSYFLEWQRKLTLTQKFIICFTILFLGYIFVVSTWYLNIRRQSASLETMSNALKIEVAIAALLRELSLEQLSSLSHKGEINNTTSTRYAGELYSVLQHLDNEKVNYNDLMELTQLLQNNPEHSSNNLLQQSNKLISYYRNAATLAAELYDPAAYFGSLTTLRLGYLGRLQLMLVLLSGGNQMARAQLSSLLPQEALFDKPFRTYFSEELLSFQSEMSVLWRYLMGYGEAGLGSGSEPLLQQLVTKVYNGMNSGLINDSATLQDAVVETAALWQLFLKEIGDIVTFRSLQLLRYERLFMGGVVLLGIIGALFSIYFMIQTAVPIKRIVETDKRLREGDQEVRYNLFVSNEWSGVEKVLNGMVHTIVHMTGRVGRSGDKLRLSSIDIRKSAQRHDELTHEQEVINKKIALRVNEISDTTKSLANILAEINAVADSATEQALRGRTNLLELEKIMQELVGSGGGLVTTLKELDGKISGITAIMNTMVSVADQTNLLSLNTALEASKVKEVGKGFAVIAEEIRRMADQSAQATLTIEYLIEEIFALMQGSVQRVQSITEEIISSVTRAAQIHKNFEEIIDKVQVMGVKFNEVSNAMEQQRDHVGGIHLLLVSLSEIANDSARLSKQFRVSLQLMHEGISGLEDASQWQIAETTGARSREPGDKEERRQEGQL